MAEYGLPAYDAGVLTASKALADYFEACVKLYDRPKTVSNWVMGELLRELNKTGTDVTASPVGPERLVSLLKLVDQGAISLKVARDIFPELYATGKEPEPDRAGEGADAGVGRRRAVGHDRRGHRRPIRRRWPNTGVERNRSWASSSAKS
ncbi:MAG: hypothetical protein KatS3mg082_0838 [Nitrospiraceae bacterium]|nr:MAG: hypothetical protein KatS3mg082_0838 [Nitrospiraceae bacterium]